MGTCCAPEKKQDPAGSRLQPAPFVPNNAEVQPAETGQRGKVESEDPASAPRHSKEWYSLSNGDRYRGEWTEAHTIHGYGVYCYQLSGFRYDGEFENHERHGYGVFTYENPNHRYEGHWDKGRRHGRGSYRMTDFSHYVGEFRDDLMHGRGVWQSPPPSTEYYNGEWVQGTKHGHGINVDTQDGFFAGHFNKGDRNGCAYFLSENITRAGRWLDEYVHGPGVEWSPNSFVFIGSFDTGKREGPGTLFFATRGEHQVGWCRFVGTWHDTCVTGPGVLFFGDGSAVYASEWEESASGSRTEPRSGQVTLSKADVDVAAAAISAAGGYPLQGGRYGTMQALIEGFTFAPEWTPPVGADAVKTCLDDPAIQLALSVSAILSKDPPVLDSQALRSLPPQVVDLLKVPFTFAFLSPPPMPAKPKALAEAEAHLRANEEGLQVSPAELGRPPHVAAKLLNN